jgi:hypothetical protein
MVWLREDRIWRIRHNYLLGWGKISIDEFNYRVLTAVGAADVDIKDYESLSIVWVSQSLYEANDLAITRTIF